MSVYFIHKTCMLAERDPAFRERLRQDPSAALADFRLTDEERSALLDGDVAKLASLGAHGYLLGRLRKHRVLGLTNENYVERMTEAKVPHS